MTNVNDNEIFIPTTHGNAEIENPIKFHIRFLTAAEQSEMQFLEFSYSESKGKVKSIARFDFNYIFKRGVTEIENCKYGKTAEEFMSARGPGWLGEMLKEVSMHIRDVMEIDEKN